MKKAVGYIRVSTVAQAEEDKFGIDSQKETILAYAKEHDFEVIEFYVDDGVSGVKEVRPALDEILYSNESDCEYEAVIVAKSDRMARDIKLYFYYLYTLEKKNIKLISVTEDFDDDSGLSNVYRSLLLFVAEQERKNICARTSSGRRLKAKGGGYSGGRAPYGYIASGGKLKVNQAEVSLVKRVFELKDDGCGLKAIASHLKEEGFITRGGKDFSPSTIKSILDNKKTYQGYYKYGDEMEYVRGEHTALI